MAFVEIPMKAPRGNLGSRMTAGLTWNGRRISLRLALGNEVLFDAGWTDETRLAISFGTGADKGKARLEPRADGVKFQDPNQYGSVGRCRVFRTTRLPPDARANKPHGAEPVSYRVHGNAIVLELPGWFFKPADSPND